ncbi:DUF6896 domain-containing protein [Streptomyces sp. NPDC005794]|uniref:DUF6896 domain-containing protein n=1 Tax=Streptomyces sp. NPDC005794 TaxID=3364733 RepID=UPI003687E74B
MRKAAFASKVESPAGRIVWWARSDLEPIERPLDAVPDPDPSAPQPSDLELGEWDMPRAPPRYHRAILQGNGAGCRFISSHGSETDVDFAADGREIFDLWRLRCYGRSLPELFGPTNQELRSAVESLQPLLVEVRPGWFSVAEVEVST